MPSSPDTLQVLHSGFASMVWSMALESMILGLTDRWGICNSSEISWINCTFIFYLIVGTIFITLCHTLAHTKILKNLTPPSKFPNYLFSKQKNILYYLLLFSIEIWSSNWSSSFLGKGRFKEDFHNLEKKKKRKKKKMRSKSKLFSQFFHIF